MREEILEPRSFPLGMCAVKPWSDELWEAYCSTIREKIDECTAKKGEVVALAWKPS